MPPVRHTSVVTRTTSPRACMVDIDSEIADGPRQNCVDKAQ